MEFCCDNFKEAFKELVISNYDPSWSSWSKEDFEGRWYILKKEHNWVDEDDYYTVGEPIKFCPWCMNPIIYNENIKV